MKTNKLREDYERDKKIRALIAKEGSRVYEVATGGVFNNYTILESLDSVNRESREDLFLPGEIVKNCECVYIKHYYTTGFAADGNFRYHDDYWVNPIGESISDVVDVGLIAKNSAVYHLDRNVEGNHLLIRETR